MLRFDYLLVVNYLALLDLDKADFDALTAHSGHIYVTMRDQQTYFRSFDFKELDKALENKYVQDKTVQLFKTKQMSLLPESSGGNNVDSVMKFVQAHLTDINCCVLFKTHDKTDLVSSLIPAFKAFGHELAVLEVKNHQLINSLDGQPFSLAGDNSDVILAEPEEGEVVEGSNNNPDVEGKEKLSDNIELLKKVTKEDTFSSLYAIPVEDDDAVIPEIIEDDEEETTISETIREQDEPVVIVPEVENPVQPETPQVEPVEEPVVEEPHVEPVTEPVVEKAAQVVEPKVEEPQLEPEEQTSEPVEEAKEEPQVDLFEEYGSTENTEPAEETPQQEPEVEEPTEEPVQEPEPEVNEEQPEEPVEEAKEEPQVDLFEEYESETPQQEEQTSEPEQNVEEPVQEEVTEPLDDPVMMDVNEEEKKDIPEEPTVNTVEEPEQPDKPEEEKKDDDSAFDDFFSEFDDL